MRGGRGSLVSVSVVLAAIGGVAVSFPFDAVSFRPADSRQSKSGFAAFVSLGAEEEAEALKAAKSSWNAEAGGVRRLRADLFYAELPEAGHEPALAFSDRLASSAPGPVEPGLSPYLPSMAAPPPKEIPPDDTAAKEGPAPAFSKEELLKID